MSSEQSSAAENKLPIVVLPAHEEFSGSTRIFEITSILIASTLCVLLLIRSLPQILAHPTWAVLWILGVIVADFASGLIHWFADTWGHETMPILGRRLLRPFRVHHLNPNDFLRRDFIDCNGDVAFLQVPILVPVLFLLDRTPWGGAFGVFCLGLCGVGMFTNQFHQWAHQRSPAPLIRWLQDQGLILGRAQHRRHHRQPHQQACCITTGWCNKPLELMGFFPRIERWVTCCTGLQPRADYHAFTSRHRTTLGSNSHCH